MRQEPSHHPPRVDAALRVECIAKVRQVLIDRIQDHARVDEG